MCEVCAAFGRGRHWTDRAGGLGARSESSDIGAHRRERRRIVSLLNRLVGPMDLTVRDWDGEAFAVSASDGRSFNAANLSELWRQVERLHGRAFDPLDDRMLEAAR